MRKPAVICLCFAFCLIVTNCTYAQNYVYATGNPTFSTQIPIENGFINVNNGDIHIEIPLATQPQRGRLQLAEKLVYDSRIWKIVSNGGYSWQPTNVANSMGGWVFSSGLGAGTVSYSTYGGSVPCDNNPADLISYSQYWGWMWKDPQGTTHPFYTVSTLKYGNGGPKCTNPPTGTPSSSGLASDGSGYNLQISNYSTPIITDQQGNVYYPTLTGVNYPPSSSNLEVDSNGNYFSTDANGNLVDTLGRTPVLVSTSGNQIYYDVLTYNGSRSRYTVTTETVNYSTAFAQEAVSEASGSFTAIQSIQLPDGSSYSFTYDSGTSSGNYGELTSVTLPTGGVIQYSYTNFLDSFQNENRWVHTRVKDSGTTTFNPQTISNCSTSTGCQEKTTVTNPVGNDTVYTFTLDQGSYINAGSWNTGIDAYQGSSTGGGIKLKSVDTAYTYTTFGIFLDENGTNYEVGTFEVPASTTTTTTLDDVLLTSQTQTTFGLMGANPSSVKLWDYYSGTAPSSPTTETDYTYYSGLSYPSQISVKDGSGNLISQTTYSYDQTTPTTTSGLPNHGTAPGTRANLTTVSQWINTSGATLNTTMTYDDAGTLLTSTDPNGATTYGHDSTDTFVTSMTPPTPSSGVQLNWSATYDASTGLLTSTTDPNPGSTITFKSYDEYGRPTEIDYPDGGKATWNYSQNQIGSFHWMNSGTATNSQTLYDGYGRVSRVAANNGQATNPWYQTDTCYNSDGQVSFQSYAYQGTGFGQAKVCSGSGDSYTYDALSRTKSMTHGDNTAINYSYTGRATQTSDENGVARITQTDALGRITLACEISSNSLIGSGSPTNCTTDIPGTGYLTVYSYNLPNHTTTTIQAAYTTPQVTQTRVFTTDSLGRTVSTQEPESGQTTYSYAYNSTGLQVTRTRPQANQGSASVTTTTTTQYDALGRPLSINYSDNTPQRHYTYDTNCCWPVTLSNVKGRIAVIGTTTTGSGPNWSGSAFSYDAMGRLTNQWYCGPSTCGTPNQMNNSVLYSYDWAGNLTDETTPPGGHIRYGRSPAGEVTSITNLSNWGTGNPTNLVSSVVNGPDGPTFYQLGNGLNAIIQYDSLGRLYGRWICQGSTQASCSGGTQDYGFIVNRSGNRAISSCDTVINICYNNGYDEFNRLTSITFWSGGTGQGPYNFTYSYDRWGNRWAQNAPDGGPGPSLSFNTATNQINSSGFTYDAAGNLTNDGANSYTYDAEGNVLQVGPNGAQAQYVYDAQNHRAESIVGGITNEYGYDSAGDRVSTWPQPSDIANEGQIYWDGMLLAYRADDGTTYFEHPDWLGNTRMRTNYLGTVSATFKSLPFGDGNGEGNPPINEGGAADQDNIHFAGLDLDNESDTDHALFRQYGNMQGRWMSPDPYMGSYDFTNPQSLNRYSYVLNNPLTLTDPTGQGPEGAAGCIGGPVGCVVGIVGSALLDDWLFNSIFGGPSFHGSLKPRPNTQPWDENSGITYGPDIAGALGLPDEPCDFGACGGIPGEDLTQSQQNAIAAAAKSWIGTPYLLGGCSRIGADCSGSIIAIYAMAGIKLPGRFTSSDFKHSPLFQRVTGNPEVGDVGWYPGHVVLFGGALVGGTCGGVPCNVWSATHTGGNPFEPANSAWFGTPVWYRYVGP